MKDFYNQLVNDDGLKFSVTLDVSPEIYVKLFITVVGAVLVSALAVNLASNVLANK